MTIQTNKDIISFIVSWSPFSLLLLEVLEVALDVQNYTKSLVTPLECNLYKARMKIKAVKYTEHVMANVIANRMQMNS